MASNSRKQLEAWLGTIEVPAGSKVIDIGGAQKPIAGRLKNRGENSHYVILDLPEPHEPGESLWKHDIQEALPENFSGNGIFDIAFCIEVSEYWYRPLEALKNINRLLKMGGILYISFHFLYPHHKPDGADFLRYTINGAAKLLDEAGFWVDEVVARSAEFVDVLEDFYKLEGMKGCEGAGTRGATGWLFKAKKI